MAKSDRDNFIARGGIVRGDVTLGKNTSVWYNAVIRGDEAPIVIGKNSNVQDCAVIHVDLDAPVSIGDDVTIGHGAVVHGCTIGDNTVIGMGATILNGAVIGRDCIIGAGSLVPGGKVIPDGMMAFGNPVKIIREVTEEEKRHNLLNAAVYVELSMKEED